MPFWDQQYRYPQESLYSDNIGKRLTPRRVRDLFRWKNGSPLSKAKRRSVEENFVRRIGHARRLPADISAEEFLEEFPSGGPIWRIFWLHCCRPETFPIYDQHVHRAMAFIEGDGLGELAQRSDPEKVRLYLGRYLPFYQEFTGFDTRSVDRALWSFGRFIKAWRIEPPTAPDHSPADGTSA